MKLTVAQLAERIGAELVGEGSAAISAVGTIEGCDENTVTFITDSRRIPALEKSRAGAVIVGRGIEGLAKPQLIVENVDAALIEALNIFVPKLKAVPEGIDRTAKVGQDVSRLDSNVVVYHNCIIGNNVIIQANSTIGSTGFGYSFIDGSHKLIPHNGCVVIEDFVEIGADCCIDRAKFGETKIGAGTKIDNLVQIAHNVVIGKCCLIAGQVGISGSCKLGDGVVLAGQVGLVDNIEIGDGTIVGAQSGVTHNVAAGQKLFGSPAIDMKEERRLIGLRRRLPKLAEQLKQLSKRIEGLEAAKDDKG